MSRQKTSRASSAALPERLRSVRARRGASARTEAMEKKVETIMTGHIGITKGSIPSFPANEDSGNKSRYMRIMIIVTLIIAVRV